MNPHPIYLIGYMGSGKTQLGRELAAAVNFQFRDLDFEIEKCLKAPINVIFENFGETRFREEESRLLRDLSSPQTIIATGGGTPVYFDNLEWMRQHGLVIYLKGSVSFLASRLKTERQQRPLIRALSDAELPEFIEHHLIRRNPFYEKAHKVVNIEDDEVLDRLVEAVRSY